MNPAARPRPMSPTGSHTMDPMRASTGTVQLSSSYDPSAGSRYSAYPSDRPYISSYDPRYARDPRLEAQPISSTTYQDPGHGAKLRTEYAIRPRTRSSTMSVISDNHLNPGPHNKPVARAPPIITSGHHRPMSPLPGQDPYLVPAASPRLPRDPNYAHTEYASDTGRLDPRERARRAHMAYGAYRRYEPNHGPWRYPPAEGLRKGEDLDKYDVYSYTNPNEHFENESVARLRYDQGRYRRERPLSLTGVDDSQLLSRKEPRSLGPPPSQRGFDKLGHPARPRRSTQGSADSDFGSSSGPRRSWHRAPVSLHQDPDEGYSSYRDDHEDGRRRHRRHKRLDDDVSSRHSYDGRGSMLPRGPVASGALVPAAPADEYDSEFYRRPRASEEREHERSGRSRRVSRRRVEDDSDAYTSDEDLKNYRREPSARRKPTGSDASTSSSERSSPYLTVERPRRRRSHSRPRPRELSPGKLTSPKDIPSRPDPVRKPDSASPDAPPKGILKPPRDKFPEEPNPIREGVAPLKDAHKKGIPPGARWTKIDRRLVNPAALEAGKERFEERPDCVIVLRVLSKEEIQAYALKTQEIRDSRYHEYVRERRRRREEDRRRGRATEDFSSDDEDENDDSPLGSEGSAELKLNPKGGQSAESGKAT